MPTPLYVIQCLRIVREGGNVDMLDRDTVEMLCPNTRAEEWLHKCSNAQYMEALQDMGAAESDDWLGSERTAAMEADDESDFPVVELDPISGLPEYLFRNDDDDSEVNRRDLNHPLNQGDNEDGQDDE